MKRLFIVIILQCIIFCGFAHKEISNFGYKELPNPVKTDKALWKNVKGIQVQWGDPNVRYKKERPPINIKKQNKLIAWKGEKVSSQLVVWTDRDIESLSLTVDDLKHINEKYIINQQCIFHGFVRYVMTDRLNKDGKGGCGARPDTKMFDSTLVADPIDHLTKDLRISSYTTRGIWISITVPQETVSGIYKGKIYIKNKGKIIKSLSISLEVKPRILPMSKNWTFHLDLWQNPFAIARYHNVELWSKEHFEAMKPYMKLYQQAGGKVITASIMHKPWNGQTYDYYESMVTWIKRIDGSWVFDYTIFDKWVEFMHSMGIKRQINCYSMVPWKLSFQYFDQASNSLKFLNMEPGSSLYEKVWIAMLKSFAQHLKDKGWFRSTYISMDERPLEVMKKTICIIRKADPSFKISLAGALHEELSDDLDDYSVALRMKYSNQIKKRRKEKGQITTFYTSCEEPHPNTFTFNPPSECEWFGWYAAKEDLSGYLRWALNSWGNAPLRDSRLYVGCRRYLYDLSWW